MPYGFTELAGSTVAPQGTRPTPASAPFPPQPDMEPSIGVPYPEPFFPENMEDEDLGGGGMPLWLRWLIFLVVLGGVVVGALYLFFNIEKEILNNQNLNIIGEEGGIFSITDGAKIIIPKDALENEVTFSIEKIEKKNALTDLYHFMPDHLEFQKPVTLLIPYREEYLALHEDEEIFLEIGSSPNKLKPIPITKTEDSKKLIGTEVMAL